MKTCTKMYKIYIYRTKSFFEKTIHVGKKRSMKRKKYPASINFFIKNVSIEKFNQHREGSGAEKFKEAALLFLIY